MSKAGRTVAGVFGDADAVELIKAKTTSASIRTIIPRRVLGNDVGHMVRDPGPIERGSCQELKRAIGTAPDLSRRGALQARQCIAYFPLSGGFAAVARLWEGEYVENRKSGTAAAPLISVSWR